MPTPSIDPQVERLFESELKSGETLKWSAAPNPSRFLRRAIPLFLMGIPFTAFSVFWLVTALRVMRLPAGFHAPEGISFLFGLPFLLAGLWMLASPFWMRRQGKFTGYFITTQRALIIQKKGFSGFKIRTFLPSELGQLERLQKSDGSGDIILTREIRRTSNNSTQTTTIGFFGIPGVKEVESLLEDLAQSRS